MEAICADVLRSQKLPLKRIGFKQLTFGDAPFRIESEWLSRGRLGAGWMACWKYRGHVLWQVLTGHHALEPPFSSACACVCTHIVHLGCMSCMTHLVHKHHVIRC